MRRCPSTKRFHNKTYQCELKQGHKEWHQKSESFNIRYEPRLRISWAKGQGRRLRPMRELIKKFPRVTTVK